MASGQTDRGGSHVNHNRVRGAVIACCTGWGLALALSAGCLSTDGERGSNRAITAGGGAAPGIDPLALRADLNAFAFTFRGRVVGAADAIMSSTADPRVQSNAIRWKMDVIPAIETASRLPDGRIALAGVWAICARQQYLLNGPFGEDNLGDQAGLARRTADELETRIHSLGKRYLPPDQAEAFAAEIEKQASQQSVILGFNPGTYVSPTTTDERNPIGALLSLPLAPIGAVSAIGNTPSEVRRFSDIAIDWGQIARQMPEHVRWQLELLMVEAQNQQPVKDFKTLAEAAGSLAQTASTLPENVGREVRSAIGEAGDNLEKVLPEVNQTIARADDVARGIDSAMEKVRIASVSIGDQSERVTETAAAWDRLAVSIDGVLKTWKEMNPPPPPGQEHKGDSTSPEDITRAADAARAAVAEVRGLLTDLQTNSLKARLAEVEHASLSPIDYASARLDGAIDRAAWRVLMLAGAVFVLSLLYRVLAVRIGRGRVESANG